MANHNAALLKLITRKPFRRTAVSATTSKDILTKLELARTTQQPVCFSVPFGGYKHHQAPLAPHLNWAEVFWLDYLKDYASAILNDINWCPEGSTKISFALSYVGGVLSFINGADSEAQADVYRQELAALCKLQSSDTITFELVDIADFLGGADAALALTQNNYQQLRDDKQNIPNISSAQLQSAARNIKPSALPLTAADIHDAALRCLAMESIPTRRAFNKYGQHIQLSHVRGELSLHIGSCRTSVTQPWVGVGIIDNGLPRIVSTSQFRSGEWSLSSSHPALERQFCPSVFPGLGQHYSR